MTECVYSICDGYMVGMLSHLVRREEVVVLCVKLSCSLAGLSVKTSDGLPEAMLL